MPAVLIADDDHLICKVYQTVLTKEGFTVQTVSDGVDVMPAVEKSRPDVILLDIMIPNLSGYDLLDKLKRDERFRSIPVITITNLNGDKICQTALAKGAIKCLIKDQNTPKEVAVMIKNVLPPVSPDPV